MRILFILPEFIPHPGGGISTYYQHYIDAIKPFCGKIKVLVGSGYLQEDKCFEYEGIEVEYLKPQNFNRFRQLFTQYELLPEFRNNLAAAWAMHYQAGAGEGYDVIECTDFAIGFIPWMICHDRPVITRLHGSSGQINTYESVAGLADNFIKQVELLTLPYCDLLLTHSKANQQFWKTVLNSEVTHINPIYNLVDGCAAYLPYNKRKDYGLITGRIQKWKGPVHLCEAIKSLGDATNDIQWYGRDMPYNNLMTTGQYLSQHYPAVWNKNIKANNPIPNDQIRVLQGQAKFGIVPSIWDMFNFSCIEFLASGTPVICSDGAGASALIEDGHNGFIYPSENSRALAKCIQKIYTMDEQEYNKMAAACVRSISESLSVVKLATKYLKNYHAIITNFKSGKKNEYLSAVFGPSDERHDLAELLDYQPLNSLLRYSLKRISRKINR